MKGMSKSLLSGACLVALLAGCASAPQKPVASADVKPNCITSASRIPRNAGDCVAPGQVYSGDDIRKTGHVGDIGAALRELDPAIH
jgi:hypothetical protein